MDQILRSSQNVSEKAEQFSYKNFTIWGIDFMKITFLKNIPFVFLTDFIHFNFELFILPAIKFAILFLNHTLKNKFLNVNCAINLSSVEMCAVEMYYWIYKLLSKHMFRLELLPQRIFSLFFHRKHQFEQILSEDVIGVWKFFRKFQRQHLQGQLQVAYT